MSRLNHDVTVLTLATSRRKIEVCGIVVIWRGKAKPAWDDRRA